MQISLNQANQIAQQAANQFQLPQTVYRSSDTYGWAKTQVMSPILRNAKTAVTWLPSNYFA